METLVWEQWSTRNGKLLTPDGCKMCPKASVVFWIGSEQNTETRLSSSPKLAGVTPVDMKTTIESIISTPTSSQLRKQSAKTVATWSDTQLGRWWIPTSGTLVTLWSTAFTTSTSPALKKKESPRNQLASSKTCSDIEPLMTLPLIPMKKCQENLLEIKNAAQNQFVSRFSSMPYRKDSSKIAYLTKSLRDWKRSSVIIIIIIDDCEIFEFQWLIG